MKHSIHFSTALIYGVIGLTFSGTVYAVPENLVETLGNEDYLQREDAEEKLTKWIKGKGKEKRKKNLEELEQLKEKAKSPEVKMRLNNVLDRIIFEPIPNTRGYIGIRMNPMMGGVSIAQVQPNTPAEKHGLKEGDVIIEIDGVDLTQKKLHFDEAMLFLRDYVKKKNAGDKLILKLLRNGDEMTKKLKLADYDRAELDGIPLRQLQGNNLQGRQVFPMPNGGNLQLQMQWGENNLDAEELKLQLDAQNFMLEMMKDQMKLQPDKKGLKQEDINEALKRLMLEQQKMNLEFENDLERKRKQLEELKKPLAK